MQSVWYGKSIGTHKQMSVSKINFKYSECDSPYFKGGYEKQHRVVAYIMLTLLENNIFQLKFVRVHLIMTNVLLRISVKLITWLLDGDCRITNTFGLMSVIRFRIKGNYRD